MTKALYRVTEAAPPRVHGRRVAPGDLLSLSEAEARYERDLGHIVPTTVEGEAQPLVGLTEAERAALPPLELLGDGPVEYAVGEGRWSEGTGVPLTGIDLPADGVEREVTLASTAIPAEPDA
ncbi:hypothetical protein [Methylobacterium nodulans]|uniref:Uncharacterized protein n=1 Tax=Methylobacterium nodulans (strain LMG 21967 / CNCM I-2342 / ORS 2060) TaxID=460265 RepID=B8IDQ4_METNO|nr:hypothetical protein [Methylobacterium nodulans]ACL55626.1 hypothetical protein Mnod_0589 [Methylobacterium nodulans ORS 2060]